VPILTINLLQALPRTPLWDRLKSAGRLIADDTGLESNVRFLRPYDEVVSTWRRCVAHAYTPERLFARYEHQIEATYANRLVTPPRGKLTLGNLKRGLRLMSTLLSASDCCRITGVRSGVLRVRDCAAARSTRCSAWASSPTI